MLYLVLPCVDMEVPTVAGRAKGVPRSLQDGTYFKMIEFKKTFQIQGVACYAKF